MSEATEINQELQVRIAWKLGSGYKIGSRQGRQAAGPDLRAAEAGAASQDNPSLTLGSVSLVQESSCAGTWAVCGPPPVRNGWKWGYVSNQLGFEHLPSRCGVDGKRKMLVTADCRSALS